MQSLPYWARATNPIVRRHLGLYWRTLPPEFEPIFYICGLLDCAAGDRPIRFLS